MRFTGQLSKNNYVIDTCFLPFELFCEFDVVFYFSAVSARYTYIYIFVFVVFCKKYSFQYNFIILHYKTNILELLNWIFEKPLKIKCGTGQSTNLN